MLILHNIQVTNITKYYIFNIINTTTSIPKRKTMFFQFNMCQYELILHAWFNTPQYSPILPEQLAGDHNPPSVSTARPHLRVIAHHSAEPVTVTGTVQVGQCESDLNSGCPLCFQVTGYYQILPFFSILLILPDITYPILINITQYYKSNITQYYINVDITQYSSYKYYQILHIQYYSILLLAFLSQPQNHVFSVQYVSIWINITCLIQYSSIFTIASPILPEQFADVSFHC